MIYHLKSIPDGQKYRIKKDFIYKTTKATKCNLKFFPNTGISTFLNTYIFHTDNTSIKEKFTDLELIFSHEPAVL